MDADPPLPHQLRNAAIAVRLLSAASVPSPVHNPFPPRCPAARADPVRELCIGDDESRTGHVGVPGRWLPAALFQPDSGELDQVITDRGLSGALQLSNNTAKFSTAADPHSVRQSQRSPRSSRPRHLMTAR